MKTLTQIIENHPDLSAYGWRFTQRAEPWNEGPVFDKNREQMQSDWFAEQVQTAQAWIREHESKLIKSGSYGAKHQAEVWGAEVGQARYISNGALICAALIEGFRAIHEANSPICRFAKTKATK